MVAQTRKMVNGRLDARTHNVVVLDEVMADLVRVWIHVEVLFFGTR